MNIYIEFYYYLNNTLSYSCELSIDKISYLYWFVGNLVIDFTLEEKLPLNHRHLTCEINHISFKDIFCKKKRDKKRIKSHLRSLRRKKQRDLKHAGLV